MTKRKVRVVPEYDPVVVITNTNRVLLELFAATDDVFTEDDAFSDQKIKVSLGRIYRAYKSARGQLDPTYEQKRTGRARRFVANKSKGKAAKQKSVVHRDDIPVLRPVDRRKSRPGKSRA